MNKLFPARYALLWWVAALFLTLNAVVRVALLAFEGPARVGLPVSGLAQAFATGLLYDVAALAYFLVPFALLALVWTDSRRGRRGHALCATALLAAMLAGLLFTAVAEGVFWNEFASRFNFIAVDYLIYTREVIGNIQQSYPVGKILAGIAAVALLIVFLLRHTGRRSSRYLEAALGRHGRAAGVAGAFVPHRRRRTARGAGVGRRSRTRRQRAL
jgi:hypothetical protein